MSYEQIMRMHGEAMLAYHRACEAYRSKRRDGTLEGCDGDPIWAHAVAALHDSRDHLESVCKRLAEEAEDEARAAEESARDGAP